MTANGKAELMEESIVYVTELDVFVIKILLEAIFAVNSLVSFVRGHGIFL